MSSERIKQLCDYIDQNKAKNYPIRNEILKSEEDFVKNGYLRMLAVVLQVGDSIQDGQMNLYKRMVAGAEAENSVEDYMRQAMEIEIQGYLDFVSACKEGELKYRFVLDAMLLTVDGEEKENRLKFITSFCENIKLKKEEMSYLVAMAKAILEQSESKYVDAFIEKDMENVAIEEDVFDGYMSGIWTGKDNIYENEKATIFRPESDEDVTSERLQYMQNIGTPYIKIIGAKIDLSKQELTFEEKQRIIFENCVFIGNEKDVFDACDHVKKRKPILINRCKNVQMVNCKFRNFASRVIYVEMTENVYIQNSMFINCCYVFLNYDNAGGDLGGVFYSEDSKETVEIHMVNTVFEKCGGENWYAGDRGLCISNCKVDAIECTFKSCYYKKETWGGKDGKRVSNESFDTLFPVNSKAIRCKFEDSARFN